MCNCIQIDTKGESLTTIQSLFLRPMISPGLLILFLSLSLLASGFRVSPVKVLKRNEMIKKVRPVPEKGPQTKTQARSSKPKLTTSSPTKAYQIITSSGPVSEKGPETKTEAGLSEENSNPPTDGCQIISSRPQTQEATTTYSETKKATPRSGEISKRTKNNSSQIHKKVSITSTNQSAKNEVKASLTKEKVSTNDGLGSLSQQGGKINVVVSAKEDTQRILRMTKRQIKRIIRKEIMQEVERATVTFIHQRFPTAMMNGMGLFLKQNALMRKMIHRMLKRYTAQVNIYARLLR